MRPDYGIWDRLLHHLALRSSFIAETSFDVDQAICKRDLSSVQTEKHVFVSGLARSGTTVLMKRFYETGIFRSLTYRDMPFVLAPNLWRSVASLSKRKTGIRERAHGDGIYVSFDSPESFDEVFWRCFAGDDYIKRSYLIPHIPDKDVLKNFVAYINAVLASDQKNSSRYLSKNNNNILRLNSLHETFPCALIFIPFRNPHQQAQSLCRQHKRFCSLQRNDAFTKSYMEWLAHHEFGLGHKRFKFSDLEGPKFEVESLNYWLEIWCDVYEWLQQSKPPSALFVSYEKLCSSKRYWDEIADRAEIPRKKYKFENFRLMEHESKEQVDNALERRAAKTFDQILESTA